MKEKIVTYIGMLITAIAFILLARSCDNKPVAPQPPVISVPHDSIYTIPREPLIMHDTIRLHKLVTIPAKIDTAEIYRLIGIKDSLIKILTSRKVSEIARIDTNLPTISDTLRLEIDLLKPAINMLEYRPRPAKIIIRDSIYYVSVPKELSWYNKPEYSVPASIITGIIIGFYGANK